MGVTGSVLLPWCVYFFFFLRCQRPQWNKVNSDTSLSEVPTYAHAGRRPVQYSSVLSISTSMKHFPVWNAIHEFSKGLICHLKHHRSTFCDLALFILWTLCQASSNVSTVTPIVERVTKADLFVRSRSRIPLYERHSGSRLHDCM